jgi:hypothetical protein
VTRRIAPAALALLLVVGCAGPSRLAQRSEEKLGAGDYGRAWDLAVRALQKEPGNARAREAAESAGNARARDWERRIQALGASDSLAAAEAVLALNEFRVNATRWAAIAVSPEQARDEQRLRQTAARTSYGRAVSDLGSKRPKRAYLGFLDAQRFVPDYRDAARLADRAREKAHVRVAVAPFGASAGRAEFGRDVAAAWRDGVAERLAPPGANFTTVLGSAAIEQQMNVSQLGRLSRADAIRLAQKAGAQRVVIGNIGGIESNTTLHVFRDQIARRITQKTEDGRTITRWVDVPVEVVARVRTVTVDVDVEVVAARDGATLAHRRTERSTLARVVWTSYAPEGDLDAYALVSDEVRTANPERAKSVEAKWKDVCGARTTLREVLEARRSSRHSGQYDRGALPRFIAGAAFVFLQDLPPAEDLAYAALASGWQPLADELLRLDSKDDVDLGIAMAGSDSR